MAHTFGTFEQPFHETIQGGLAKVPQDLYAGQHLIVDLDATTRCHFAGQLMPEMAGFLRQIVDDEVALSLSLATLNPKPLNVIGVNHMFDQVYTSRFERTDRGIKLFTKFHPGFYRWIADDLEADTSQLVVIDNSHFAGLWAAGRAGCNTVQVDPLCRSPIPSQIRILSQLDRRIRTSIHGPATVAA